MASLSSFSSTLVWIRLFLVFAFLATALTVQADVRMPAIFGDHMVLQGGAKLPVWGTADAGEKVTVTVGKQNWPFPIPLVRTANGLWQFDSTQGRTEIIARHIGSNELNAVEICRAYVEAQNDYAEKHHHKGVPEYAQRSKSLPDQENGLYWESKST